MKEALLHLDNAIRVLRQSAGAHAAIISTLEGVRARLIHNIFGVSLALEQDRSPTIVAQSRSDDAIKRCSASPPGFGPALSHMLE